MDTSLPTRILTAHLKHLKQQGRSQGTIDARRRHLVRMGAVIPVPLLEATPEHLAAWRESLRVTGNTAVQYAAHARGFYQWAVKTGRIASNPADGLALPHLVRGLPRPIGEADLMRALETAPHRVRPWLTLAGWAGFRACEIAKLRRENVLETATPPVLLIAADATKGRRERIVPAAPLVLTELRLAGLPRSGYVFPRYDGLKGHNAPYTISHVANNHLREYGATLHQLRHRFGTILYQQTKDLRLVQELLGHADPATTALYAAYDKSGAADAVNALPAPGRLAPVQDEAG